MAIAANRRSDTDTLLSVADAAIRLGVHPNTIRAWADAGRLPAYRINARGDRRFRPADVDRLLGEGSAAERAVSDDQPASAAALEALAMLSRGAAGANSPVGACRAAVEALRTHAGYRRAAVYLVDDQGALSLATHAGYAVPLPPSIARPDTTDTRPAAAPGPVGDRLEMPLATGGELQGMLVAEPGPDAEPSTTDPRFLRAAAGSLAAALHTARHLARARRELKRSRALRAVTQEITGQLDLNVVLDDIVDRTRALFDADKAGLWLVHEREHPFELVASHGIGPEFDAEVRRLTLNSDTIGIRALRQGRPQVMERADTEQGAGLLQSAYASEGIRTVCLAPLVTRGQAVGLLGLYHARERAWPDAEVALVQAFANQAAVAISNARLYRSVADQAARMRSIQDLSARLNRLTDVRAIAEAIVAEARTLADYYDIRVYTIDWERRTCEPVAYTKDMLGEGGDYEARLRVPVGEGSLTGWVAEHGEPLLVNDALHDPRAMTIPGTDEIEESMLLVPMLFEGHAVGVIVLSQLGFERFTDEDLQTMTIFAGYAAQAIANAAAYERLELQSAQLARQLDSQRRLLEINERLLSTLDSADVLETIADGLHSVVSYDNLSIYRADHDARLLIPVFTREQHAAEVGSFNIPFGRGLMGWVVEHAEPVLANDALNDPRALQIPGTPPDPEAVILVPLISGGVTIGAVNVSRVGGEEVYFSAADFELVKLFAGQASIALRNADEHRAVSLRAETDALTGLGNHGAFQRDLGRLLQQTDGAAATRRVAMLMMDLDQFKAYNDRLGHPAGDALLHAVGAAISGAARSGDRVYRYGGDEFALIVPGASAVDAARVAERVRRAVARLTAREPDPVTITVGVAVYPDDAADRDGLVSAADAALYYGKRSGEDRVVRADRVPDEVHALRRRRNHVARADFVGADEPRDGGAALGGAPRGELGAA